MGLSLNVGNKRQVYLNHDPIAVEIHGDKHVTITFENEEGEVKTTGKLAVNDSVEIKGAKITVFNILKRGSAKLDFEASEEIIINSERIYNQSLKRTGGFIVASKVYRELYKALNLPRESIDQLIKGGTPKSVLISLDTHGYPVESGIRKNKSLTFFYANNVVYSVGGINE
ncbi:hypothetical protein S1R3X_000080 [Vibrio phage vB_ValS_VA-RY-4]|nr:hypothetical protein S1R3X_000080 [Vibrio phage vB_ValS_VA-RY-4]